MSVLSRDDIKTLICSQPPLVAEYQDLENQLQPNGFDLTVQKVERIVSQGVIGPTNDQRVLSKKKPVLSVAAIGVSGLTFLANAGIAVFHTGVERKWWAGLQGCSAPDLSGSVDDLLERIQNSNGARCDEIPWADPIFGLSMANYNILYCLLLAVFCFAVVTSFVKQSRG